MTPSECDFYRAKKIEHSKQLAQILLYAPMTYDFTGAKSSTGAFVNARGESLDEAFSRLQQRFFEWRSAFVTTKSRHAIDWLASDLIRVAPLLTRNATGWLDFDGRVHRFGCDNPKYDDPSECACELAEVREPSAEEQLALDSL